MLSYTTSFQYGAQVQNDPNYRIHTYLDERKFASYQSPFDSPYPKIDIDLKYFKVLCKECELYINEGDINGQTPLHALCLYGSINSINILLELGADKKCLDNFGFALSHYCGMSDREDILSFLGGTGLSMTTQALVNSRTPLHIASMCNSVRCVEYLLDTKLYNINQADNFGYSPLWLALYYGNDEVCQLLYKKGAKLSDKDQILPVFRAANKCSEFAKLTLDSLMSSCPYRGVSAVWLNQLVSEITYEDGDLTYSYLHLTPPSKQFIQHPVVKSFISVVWRFIGRKNALMNVARDVIFSVIWTFHFMSDTGKTFRDVNGGPKIAAYVILLPFTCYMIYHKISILKGTYSKQAECIQYEKKLLDREFENVHPCMWNVFHVLKRDKNQLDLKRQQLLVGKVLGHHSLELFIIFLSLIVLVLDLVMTAISDNEQRSYSLAVLYMVITSLVLILVWANSFLKFRYFKEFGTFLISVQQLYKLLIKFSIMFLVFYIPVSCIFWKTIYHVPRPDGNLYNTTFLDAFYSVYRMTYSDYTYSDGLDLAVKAGYPSWWDILTFYWITLGSLILLKVLGAMIFALLTATPDQRQFEALRQRLDFICELLIAQDTSKRRELARHLELNCQPFIIKDYNCKE